MADQRSYRKVIYINGLNSDEQINTLKYGAASKSEPIASEPIASEPIASEPIASEPIASEPTENAAAPA
ncbi:hypothetical protein B0T17DRAFT_621677 [Bombardia bombarda]|uniref:Uncharacterized protein n=1 Tax=Bombardia bombarda TaxID=252184 RepID=A0AA39TLC7_9PEZI|nr:hypothetical protein B0T17DRAFT_621677 [Bombardia bombarda]